MEGRGGVVGGMIEWGGGGWTGKKAVAWRAGQRGGDE